MKGHADEMEDWRDDGVIRRATTTSRVQRGRQAEAADLLALLQRALTHWRCMKPHGGGFEDAFEVYPVLAAKLCRTATC